MNFKFNVGYPTEDSVQRIVEDAFSSDFVFRSPRREEGKEVTDVLVLFEDVALIIQSKAQAIDLTNSESSSSLDWVTKNLDKAGRQIRGAARAVRAGKMPYVEKMIDEAEYCSRARISRGYMAWLFYTINLSHIAQRNWCPSFEKSTYQYMCSLYMTSGTSASSWIHLATSSTIWSIEPMFSYQR